MKKSIFILGLILILAMLLVGCGRKNTGENIYFAMPKNLANTSEGWSKVPMEVYRYTGGETCSPAYTFPDTEDYAYCLSGALLYYVPLNGGPVTSVDLKGGGEKTLGELPSGGTNCLAAEGDKVFAAVRDDKKFALYEVSDQNTRMICEDIVVMAELAIGDGGLFYIDNTQEMALMRYDLKTGESRKIADKVGIGDLEYDSGYVYSGNTDTLRYDVKTGESSFVASWSGYRVRDGWLYYADNVADRDPGWKEFMRRNLKNGKTESLGTAYVPYLEDQTLRQSIVFGEKGFIVYITFFKEDTKYMYFPYEASQGIELSISKEAAK